MDLPFRAEGSDLANDTSAGWDEVRNRAVNLIPLQSRYAAPAGSTIECLFPETTDPFFVVVGDVSIGSDPRFRFAYETQVIPAPGPATLWLLGSGLALLGYVLTGAPRRAR